MKPRLEPYDANKGDVQQPPRGISVHTMIFVHASLDISLWSVSVSYSSVFSLCSAHVRCLHTSWDNFVFFDGNR